MNLGCFFVCILISHLIFDLRLAQEENKKIRLTGMAAANATVDKIPMFVIGKSKSPCCFRGVKHLHCRYRNQNKSWMDSVLFDEWIREMDTKFTKQKKKLVPIIDNCPAYPTIDNLKYIELIFLLPNTTSKLQPMDQGVKRSLKAYYKALGLQRLVVAIDKGKDLLVFSILGNENARSCMAKSENFHYR